MDPTMRSYLDAFMVGVFPLLTVYIAALLKSQIEKLHQGQADQKAQTDKVLTTLANVQAVSNTISRNVNESAAGVPTTADGIPPAKG